MVVVSAGHARTLIRPAEQQARDALEVPVRMNSAHPPAAQSAIGSMGAEFVRQRLKQQSLVCESQIKSAGRRFLFFAVSWMFS